MKLGAKHAKYICEGSPTLCTPRSAPHALHPAPCVPRALYVAIECMRPLHVARALRVACDWGLVDLDKKIGW